MLGALQMVVSPYDNPLLHILLLPLNRREI